MFNEGQKQILSKGELKRYKGEKSANSSMEDIQNNEAEIKEPEEYSQLI